MILKNTSKNTSCSTSGKPPTSLPLGGLIEQVTRRASAELPESNTDEDALGSTPHP